MSSLSNLMKQYVMTLNIKYIFGTFEFFVFNSAVNKL